ncbi:GTP-binding protein [Streptomyces sp. NPDC088254]|uniref:GTP-binding protein n=1 Tax=Streptomyces sp. NPDC088254 TaxID=3365847 RepID=UPI003824CEE5
MTKGVLCVVSGNAPGVRGTVVDQLLHLRPSSMVLAASLDDLGGRYPVVQRFVTDAQAQTGDIAARGGSGDPAVILRQDLLSLLPTLRGRAERPHVVLTLPGELDLLPFLVELWRPRLGGSSLADHFEPGPVVVGLEAAPFLKQMGCVHRTVRLWAGDGRAASVTLAEAAARQVEAADTLLIPALTGTHTQLRSGVAALAGHLNGRAPLSASTEPVTAVPVHGGGWEEWRARLEPVSVPLIRSGRHEGVESVLWRSRRPLHPGRLADALAPVMNGVVRSRGHLWLSCRPNAVITWRSAGAHLTLQECGEWLRAEAPDDWTAASAQRRALASWFWHDYYGERRNEIVFTGVDLDALGIRSALNTALLTDAELALGEEGWATFPDPLLSTDGTA